MTFIEHILCANAVSQQVTELRALSSLEGMMLKLRLQYFSLLATHW